jgi:tetratricopeptide (TPR) repeat protein
MKKLLTLTLLCSLYLPASYADQTTINNIENAAMELNANELTNLINNSQGYDQALAQYRLSITKNIKSDNEQAIIALNSAMTILEEITQQSPQDDETWALLAQVYGLKIAYEPTKGAIFGPKSAQALSRALSLNPENPRAYLVLGVSKYNTPAMYGGSKSSAFTALNKAITLFAQDSSTDRSWGYAEAFTWRGLSQLALNDKSQAINDWQQALDIAPNYGWAKMLLKQNQ